MSLNIKTIDNQEEILRWQMRFICSRAVLVTGKIQLIRINKEATSLPAEEVTASGEGQDTADKDQQSLKPVPGSDFACQMN